MSIFHKCFSNWLVVMASFTCNILPFKVERINSIQFNSLYHFTQSNTICSTFFNLISLSSWELLCGLFKSSSSLSWLSHHVCFKVKDRKLEALATAHNQTRKLGDDQQKQHEAITRRLEDRLKHREEENSELGRRLLASGVIVKLFLKMCWVTTNSFFKLIKERVRSDLKTCQEPTSSPVLRTCNSFHQHYKTS